MPAEEERERYVALLSYATVVGGLELHARNEPLWPERLQPLLPDSHRLKESLYRDIVGDYSSTVSLPSLQPDILGEFFVLERLRGSTGAQVTTHAILDAAWDADPEGVSQFVRRAAADFWNHPSTRFLQDPVVRTPSQRDVWSLMVADLVGFGAHSDDPQLNANLSALRRIAEAHPDEAGLQQHRARAEFNLGTLLLMENEYPAADSQLSTAIDLQTAGPDTQGNALNNRGIARWHYQSKEAAFEDFSRVISLPGASNEVRACALNNRADIFFEDGDHEGAIRDRSAVLELQDTTYDRRYIAHIRRCRAYLAIGKRTEALDDLNAILATDDIALEQKMAARLKRASLLMSKDSNAALQDLTAVIESPANFAGTAAEALVAREKLFLEADDIGPAIQDFIATLSRTGASEEDVLTAHVGLGVAFAEIGETAEARAAWLFVRDHPRVSEEARQHADAVLTSLED